MTLPVLAQPRDRAAARPRTGRALAVAAAVMTCLSVAVFAALSASGDPAILAPIGPAGPFADLHHQVAPALMKAACWLAAAGGGAGVVTGLAAVRRGWRPHPGLLLAACSAVTLVLGHNPWVMTPEQLFRRHDPVGVLAPPEWRGQPTVYGPAATAVEAVAARLGGTSMAWIAFWIKVVNGICFVAVAALLDRLAGPDQARRARASWRASRSPSRSPSPAPSRGSPSGCGMSLPGTARRCWPRGSPGERSCWQRATRSLARPPGSPCHSGCLPRRTRSCRSPEPSTSTRLPTPE